jgi:anti-anti-sigma regulatory factor
MSHDPLAEVAEATSNASESGEESGVLSLPDCLTIVEVGDFHPQLAARLVEGGEVSIDGAAVETIDGAGLQLLAAFVKDLVGKSSVVRWQGVSEALQRGASRLGLEDALQLGDQSQAA